METEEENRVPYSFVKPCQICDENFLVDDLDGGICKTCNQKLAEGIPLDKVVASKTKVICIDCGRSAQRKKLKKSRERVSRFFIDGRCLPCHKKLLRMRREDSLFDLLKDEVVLTDEEKVIIEKEHGRVLVPVHVIEEMLIRIAAGQYIHDVCESLNSQYNLKIDSRYGTELGNYTRRPALRPILQRLRQVLNSRKTCELVPITNKFKLALRLEGLYQEAEQAGNIRDRLLILRAANEILLMEEGKSPQQTNFLTIIQRIEASNLAQRAVSANFSEIPAALPMSRIEDRLNGTAEQRSFIEADK